MNTEERQRIGSSIRFPALVLSILLGTSIVSCSGWRPVTDAPDTVTTSSGLKFMEVYRGSGAVAQPGMIVAVHYTGYLPDGTLFSSSIDSIARANRFWQRLMPLEPITFTLGRGEVIAGWEEAISADMRIGDRRRLIVPPSLAYGGKRQIGILPNSTLVFDIELVDAYREDTVTTIEGLRYIDREPGSGIVITRGMQVKVDYAGYLSNGKLFDTSIESVAKSGGFSRGGYPFEPISFRVGSGEVIQGWEIALASNMRVGGKRRLIIPPGLGYGQYGSAPAIPPNATLVFDIEVLDAR